MQTSFYSEEELATLGLARYGKHVQLSRKASLYSPEKIEIGNNVRIDDFTILSGSIHIGNHVHIAAYVALFGSEGITVEDFTGLSSRVSVYTVSDDYLGMALTGPTIPPRYLRQDRAPVVIEKHVIVGAGSVILPGVRIGIGTAIGALSLVSSDCEPWQVYVGVPVRIKKNRRSDIILKYQADLEREERMQQNG